MQQNQIPSHPGVSAPQGAVGGAPIQVHQGAPAGIPSHPDVLTARAQQMHIQAPQPTAPSAPANPAADFFARTAFEADADDFSPEPQGQQPSTPNPQQTTDLVNIDDLLGGGEFQPEPQSVPQQQQPQVQQPQVAQPQAPVAQQPQAPAPQPQAQAPSPEQLQAQAMDYLRDNVYRFDDETTRRALSEPEVVLPQLAARLHVNLINEFANQMHRTLPALIEREVTRRTQVMEAKSEFFRRYPKLNNPAWEPVIADSIAMAAQIHAGKSRHEIMHEGAVLAAYRLRGQAPRPSPAPGRPQAFVPANPGGGGPVVPQNPQQQSNPWAELAADPTLMDF